jgi:hypothetical protein
VASLPLRMFVGLSYDRLRRARELNTQGEAGMHVFTRAHTHTPQHYPPPPHPYRTSQRQFSPPSPHAPHRHVRIEEACPYQEASRSGRGQRVGTKRKMDSCNCPPFRFVTRPTSCYLLARVSEDGPAAAAAAAAEAASRACADMRPRSILAGAVIRSPFFAEDALVPQVEQPLLGPPLPSLTQRAHTAADCQHQKKSRKVCHGERPAVCAVCALCGAAHLRHHHHILFAAAGLYASLELRRVRAHAATPPPRPAWRQQRRSRWCKFSKSFLLHFLCESAESADC